MKLYLRFFFWYTFIKLPSTLELIFIIISWKLNEDETDFRQIQFSYEPINTARHRIVLNCTSFHNMQNDRKRTRTP